MRKMPNKELVKMVKRLCRKHRLSVKDTKCGIKLITQAGQTVGTSHATLSDRRALKNFEHDVERNCESLRTAIR